MKVLFVSSGNNKFGISPIIYAQGESLRRLGVELEYFTIISKGLLGYTNNIIRLKKHLNKNNFDLIHSHYFLSSVVATLANSKNIVVSLMGSDVYTSQIWNYLIRMLNRLKWKATIVKSARMKEVLKLKDLYSIPNGVDGERFYPIEKKTAREILGWDKKKYVLFASSIERPEKNYELSIKAISNCKEDDIELVTLKDIPHLSIVYYLNAADLLLMTSKYEGSSNIIKEAMACNCPIVSTNVGDVAWVLSDTAGCYITSFEPDDVAEKIKLALKYAREKGRTKGRDRIFELGLDSQTVAKRLIDVYKKVLYQSA